jgi:uncharacterized protein
VAEGAEEEAAVVAEGRWATSRVGLGWRPHLAGLALSGEVDFVEVIAESVPCGPEATLPAGLELVRASDRPVVPHGLELSLGGAGPPDVERVRRLAAVAELVGAPVVSEHLAFTRAGRLRAGHLLPVPHTRAAAVIVAANARQAADGLPVPLALEPIASLVRWPDDELSEAEFATEVTERSGCGLLLDLANLFTNGRNHGFDPLTELDRYPLERVAYVHVAGGHVHGGLHHDTHTDPLWPEVLDLLAELRARRPDVPVLLERDDDAVRPDDLVAELRALAAGPRRGAGGLRSSSPVTGMGTAKPGARFRSRLGVRQAALLASLVGGGPEPEGFDAERLAAVRAVLLDKRVAAVRRSRPDLVTRPGADFDAAFADWATAHPPPVDGCSASDAAAFARSWTRFRRRSVGGARAPRSGSARRA